MFPPPRTIGVIGGMGPEATVLFMQRVIEATPATDDRDHVPMLVDNNTQVPSRIAALIRGGDDDPGPTLAAMARNLENAGASALVMPCNTAHHYAPQIREAVSIPFLSMVDLTAAKISEDFPDRCTVGLLASPAVRLVGVYDKAFAAFPQLRTLYGDEDGQLLSAIQALKISSTDAQARATIRSVARELIDRGANILLIACTEFSLLARELAADQPCMDSLDIAVSETIRFSMQDRQSQELQRA